MSAPDRQIRRLTVPYGARTVREPDGSSAPAPMLRLPGAWLNRAGFAIGVPVTIRVSSGRLVIEAAEPARVLQEEAFAQIARVADGDLLKRDVDRFVAQLRRGRRQRHRDCNGFGPPAVAGSLPAFPRHHRCGKYHRTVQWYMPRPSS
ncbi:MAG: SymE family type I addiction module toxin [Steroidobacteraceae bacterium]